MFGAARLSESAFGVQGGKSYWAGGYVSGAIATTRTYNLVTGATATGSNNLSQARFVGVGFGNGVNGYMVAGVAGSTYYATTSYFAFATDTSNNWTWTNGNNAPGSYQAGRGASSNIKGYSWGGYNGSAYTKVNYQLTYSTGNWASATALNWTTATGFAFVHCNSTNAAIIDGYASTAAANQSLLYAFATDANTFTSSSAYEASYAGAATGNQSFMVKMGGWNAAGNSQIKTVVKYNLVTTSYTYIRDLPVTYGFSNDDAAGDDFVGIYAGKWTGQTTGTVAESEWSYYYTNDVSTQLTSYLANSSVYTVKTESASAFHSRQIS